nr:unnamed protein product [Callosobruchus chinensis]CAH7721556.1 unnamed protein product [Callosobruchus chinensis]CAH7731469.1 unnamed protein product [Callosobruchus chinensis]CAH7731808.1 unnamed protein product [Callosobruchus chinensis]CAH7745166.1 unnamed protein product [Callosobruchus chinensis]
MVLRKAEIFSCEFTSRT